MIKIRLVKVFIHGTIEYDFSVSMNFVFDNFLWIFFSLFLFLLFGIEMRVQRNKNQMKNEESITSEIEKENLYITGITFDFIIKIKWQVSLFVSNIENV